MYQTVTIQFSSPDTLNARVDAWDRILERAESFKHVHHIQVLAKHLRTFGSSQRFNDCGDDPISPWKYCFIDAQQPTPVFKESKWELLAWVIEKLPALCELTWGCGEQIPAHILRYINQYRAHLRLHMRNFKLRCLYQPTAVPITLDPYEVELATSPCPYSIAMYYDTLDDGGYADYNEDAIRDMLAGAAPNLRELDLFWQDSGSSFRRLQASRGPRHRYLRGSIHSSAPATSLGSLERLDIVALDSSQSLKAWSQVTDFSKLSSLEMHNPLHCDGLVCLASTNLSSLTSLALELNAYNEDVLVTTAVLEELILSLPYLEMSKLSRTYERSSISLTLDHCGDRLRSLLLSLAGDLSSESLKPHAPGFATLAFIEELQQKCPRLEELSLCIFRSQGDANEVAIYRALGSLASLRRIHLSIYCPQPFTWDLEEQDMLPRTKDSDSEYARALCRVWPESKTRYWTEQRHNFALVES